MFFMCVCLWDMCSGAWWNQKRQSPWINTSQRLCERWHPFTSLTKLHVFTEYMGDLPGSLCMPRMCRIGGQTPWDCSCRQLWVLGVEPNQVLRKKSTCSSLQSHLVSPSVRNFCFRDDTDSQAVMSCFSWSLFSVGKNNQLILQMGE